jgi:hypothetical protein
MARSLLCLCMLVAALGLLAQPARAAGKNKKVLAAVKGKIYLTNDILKDNTPAGLAEKFAEKEPSLALERASDDTWSATMVGFLSRRPVRGPVYLWIADKDNVGKPLFTKSIKLRKGGKYLIYDLLLDGELGFKKCGAYVMQVGQILNGKNKAFAAGAVLTDPKDPKCKKAKKAAKKKTPSK